MFTRPTRIAIACAGIFASIASLRTFATEDESSALKVAQPITVYASRFEEKVTDTLPQTTVISSGEIQKSGAINISEVLSKVAGIATKTNLDGSTNAVIDIRGYGDTADNNVVILLDGVRLSENEQATARTSMLPLEAIDHIEITKGGYSVLYGDGATSGTINIITKKNLGNVTVASAGISSYSGYQSSIYHSQDIGATQLSLFARGYTSDGYRQNSKTLENSAGASLISNIDATTHIGVRFLVNQEKDRLPGSLPLVYLNASPQNSQVPGYKYNSDTNSSSISLFGSKKIENVEMLMDLSQRIKSNDMSYNYNAQNVYTGYSPTLSPMTSSAMYSLNNYCTAFDNISCPNNFGPQTQTYAYGQTNSLSNTQAANPRIRVNDFGFSNNSFIFGYDWVETTRGINGYHTNAYDPSGIDPFWNSSPILNFSSNASFKSQGIYFRDDWKLSAHDRLTFGYRSQTYLENYSSSSSWSTNGRVSANEIQYSRNINNALTGYVRLSENFRLPNVDDNSSVVQNIPLVPQKSHDLDVGFIYKKSDWSSEFKYFRSNVHNEIGFDPSVNWGYGGNVNYAPTRREGFEVKQYLKFADKWDLKLNAQYVNAYFIDGTYASNLIPNVSKINGNLTFDYLIDGRQQVSLTSRFSGKKYASGDYLNNQQMNPGYMVNDLVYVYKEKNWSLTGGVNNILNKQYTDVTIYKPYNSGDGYYYISPYNLTAYPNPGRNFSLVGRYIF